MPNGTDMLSQRYIGLIILLLTIVVSDSFDGEPISLSMQMGEAPPPMFDIGRSPANRQRKSADLECPRPCTPVCGENGMTYCNKCHAECLRIPLESEESCPTYPKLVDDECANCPSDYIPVCACGRVYYNSCVAACMDIWSYDPGLCW